MSHPLEKLDRRTCMDCSGSSRTLTVGGISGIAVDHDETCPRLRTVPRDGANHFVSNRHTEVLLLRALGHHTGGAACP